MKMTDMNFNESMLDMYIFETSQNIEQLEASILNSESTSRYTREAINEIFRIMHTIKGSSAMMLFGNISTLAHGIEDVFYFLREQEPQNVDCSRLSDLILQGVDFIKAELGKIKNADKADGDATILIDSIREFLSVLKRQNPGCGKDAEEPESAAARPVTAAAGAETEQKYYIAPQKSDRSLGGNMFRAAIFFEAGCEMENIRAYTVIHNLKEFSEEIFSIPDNVIENKDAVSIIRERGFTVYVKTGRSLGEMHDFFMGTIFLKDLELVQLENDDEFKQFAGPQPDWTAVEKGPEASSPVHSRDNNENERREQPETHYSAQSMISVNVAKLDTLMDLMGELVISEAMVTQNPDLKGMVLENFQKAAGQLHKITGELQDMVMSIRMVPLSATFQRMRRIVRDMGKKLDKEVELKLIGEETEVDKNIIEHISDPLMHLVRNSIDHGIEATEDREASGKPKAGTVTLEARNSGSDVLIIVKDDGKGLDKTKILERAANNGLLSRPGQEMPDREIYNLIFLPGFSTRDGVSEFSGRGVGMDVVIKNIEAVGGSVSIESTEGSGTAVTLKIPLTLAIIDGMNINVGNSRYTIPTNAIVESFKPGENDIITDPEGNEMVMVRGDCYPILRLHRLFGVKTDITDFSEGILIMTEQDGRRYCLFADGLLGQQQVVVKTLPKYITNKRLIRGLSGCTLLGDGSISLILDTAGII